jgi:diguanylate cyclase (GGDEF)-like protein/PAS domain S-box-containing protein
MGADLDQDINAAALERARAAAEAAERESRRSAALFRATFEQAAVGIAHIAPDGHWLRVNHKLCAILGYSADEMLRMRFQDITYADDLAHDMALVRQLLDGDIETCQFDKRYLRRDRSPLWVSLTVSLVRDEQGAPDYFLTVVEDIARRKAAEAQLQAEREMFRALTDIATDYFWEIDADFRFVEISQAIARRSGLDYKSYIGHTRWELPFVGVSEAAWTEHRRLLEAQQPFRNFEGGLPNMEGEVRWFLISGGPVFDAAGRCTGYRGVTQDITDRRRVEEQLQRQAMVFQTAQEGIVITDTAGDVIDVNPAFERITEYSADEVRGRNMRFMQSGRHDAEFYREMWRQIAATGNWQGEIWNRRKHGDVYLEWINISTVRDERGVPIGHVGVAIDINRMQHVQTELERHAHHDALTELPNRVLLRSRLERSLARARRHGSRSAVLFIDLDHFKQVNDRYGHKAGDRLLQGVAQRLRARVRTRDTVARLGGDEFVIVLEEVDAPQAAARIAEDVITRLSAPVELAPDCRVEIGASVGIALFPDDASEAGRLIDCADEALYAAKAAGRNTFRFYREPGPA